MKAQHRVLLGLLSNTVDKVPKPVRSVVSRGLYDGTGHRVHGSTGLKYFVVIFAVVQLGANILRQHWTETRQVFIILSYSSEFPAVLIMRHDCDDHGDVSDALVLVFMGNYFTLLKRFHSIIENLAIPVFISSNLLSLLFSVKLHLEGP